MRSWIFLRGLARHSVHWGPFPETFKKFFPEDELELLDVRGNGKLSHSPSFLSIQDNVRDLRARSQFLSQGKSVYLMTISFGSMVGVEWARSAPHEIEGLVAINTSDRGHSTFLERLKPQNYFSLLHILTGRMSPEHREEEILKMTTHLLANPKDWAHLFAKTEQTSRLNFARQIFAASHFDFPEQKPKTEMLLLASEKDHFVSSRCTKNIAEMWTLKPHLHPTAGHDLPMEDPAWICQEVKNWLSLHPVSI